MTAVASKPVQLRFDQQMIVVPQEINQASMDARLEHIEHGLLWKAWQQGYSVSSITWDFWVEQQDWVGHPAWWAFIHATAIGTRRP